jgi:hypothetical protein
MIICLRKVSSPDLTAFKNCSTQHAKKDESLRGLCRLVDILSELAVKLEVDEHNQIKTDITKLSLTIRGLTKFYFRK